MQPRARVKDKPRDEYLEADDPNPTSCLRGALEAARPSWAGRVSEQTLFRRVLLHLPRFRPDEVIQREILEKEILRLAEEWGLSPANIPSELRAPVGGEVDLRKTKLGLVDDTIAEIVHRTRHYLRSYRSGTHLGLFADAEPSPKGCLLALATLSPFDLTHLQKFLPSEISREQTLVLSRLYACEGAPSNSLSYFLGRVFAWLREHRHHVSMLLTYLNPNLGFPGTIYRASNWILWARESKQGYLYVDGNYITDRHAIETYGANDLDKLRAILGGRVSRSSVALQPLEIFVYFLNPGERKRYRAHLPCEVSPSFHLS